MCQRDGHLDSARNWRTRSRSTEATRNEVAVRFSECDCARIGYCRGNSKPRSRAKNGSHDKPTDEYRVRPPCASLVPADPARQPTTFRGSPEPRPWTRSDVPDRVRRLVQRAVEWQSSIRLYRRASCAESTRSDPRTSSRRKRPRYSSRETRAVFKAGPRGSRDHDGAAKQRRRSRRKTEGLPCHIRLSNRRHPRSIQVSDRVRNAAATRLVSHCPQTIRSVAARTETRSSKSKGWVERWAQ
jgi:hypothetical protein